MQTREYPKTYAEFEGKSKNGAAPRKYWIQDVPEEFFDEIVDHLNSGFAMDEPISKYKKGYTDEATKTELRVYQYEMLREKICLACLTKDNQGEVKLAGFNMLIITKNDEDDDDNSESKGWFLPFIISIYDYVDEQRNLFEEFGVDKCLKGTGLYVLPEYRGEGICEQILRARVPLCKDLGIKLISTIFTSTLSQKAAYKAGYKDFYSIDYEDLFKEKPEFYISGIQDHSKSIKILYQLVE